MSELPIIKTIIKYVFYGYKIAGAVTIPVITLLFMVSTANLLLTGRLAVSGIDFAWAIVYAICFEMNGIRLVIDASIEAKHKQIANAVVDYIIGISLIVLGTAATLIESLTTTGAVNWQTVTNFLWIVFLIRSLAVIAMIVRECVHYGPAVLGYFEANQIPNNPVTQIVINQTNQTANIVPNQTLPEVTKLIEDSEPNIKLLPEKSSVRGDKKQTIIELLDQTPNMKQSEIVRQTGFSKGYVSQVVKELR